MVLTCIHNLFFKPKYEKIKKNQLKIVIFSAVKKLLYIAWACFRNEEDPIKNEGARVFTTFSPLYPLGSYWLPWTPEVSSDLIQNLMHPFPLPNDASDKIWLRLAHWLGRYSSLKMFTDRHTDRQTDNGSTGIL